MNPSKHERQKKTIDRSTFIHKTHNKKAAKKHQENNRSQAIRSLIGRHCKQDSPVDPKKKQVRSANNCC